MIMSFSIIKQALQRQFNDFLWFKKKRRTCTMQSVQVDFTNKVYRWVSTNCLYGHVVNFELTR